MPYIAIIVPSIPEAHKDKFLAAWPQIAAQIKALPMTLGVSGGPFIGEDGAPVEGFKFFQSIAFATKEDEEAFKNSDWAKESKKEFEERAKAQGLDPAMPPHALFECSDFPKDATPPAFTQMSRIGVSDPAKLDEVKSAWDAVMAALGKPTWGGKSVGGDKTYGLGFVGWDSIADCKAAYEKADVKAAFEKYKSLGECKDVLVQMTVY